MAGLYTLRLRIGAQTMRGVNSALLTKPQAERRIFESLASLACLDVQHGSIVQAPPPAPDIECQIAGYGPLAVELTAIDSESTRARLAQMFSIEKYWKAARAQWPQVDQARLNAECTDMHLALNFRETAGPPVRTKAIKVLQRVLLDKGPGFSGQPFSWNTLPDGLFRAAVFRGHVANGPSLYSPTAGSWEPPQLSKIVEKLTAKNYQTAAPLELFVYSTHDDPDAAVGSLQEIVGCISQNLPGSAFQRVRVFDFATQRHLYSSP